MKPPLEYLARVRADPSVIVDFSDNTLQLLDIEPLYYKVPQQADHGNEARKTNRDDTKDSNVVKVNLFVLCEVENGVRVLFLA